jgi:hypothetical protein
VEIVVIEGDPREAGPFTMRLPFPAGCFLVIPLDRLTSARPRRMPSSSLMGLGPWGTTDVDPADDPGVDAQEAQESRVIPR